MLSFICLWEAKGKWRIHWQLHSCSNIVKTTRAEFWPWVGFLCSDMTSHWTDVVLMQLFSLGKVWYPEQKMELFGRGSPLLKAGTRRLQNFFSSAYIQAKDVAIELEYVQWWRGSRRRRCATAVKSWSDGRPCCQAGLLRLTEVWLGLLSCLVTVALVTFSRFSDIENQYAIF